MSVARARTGAAAALLLLAAACSGADGPGALRFETPRVELGDMHSHEEREFAIPFVVEGAGPVRVDLLDVTCGCTDVRLMVGETVLLQAEKGADAHPDPEPGSAEDKGLSAEAGDRLIELQPGTRGEVRGVYRPGGRRLEDQYVGVTVAGSMLNSPVKAQIHAFVKPMFVAPASQSNFGTVRETVLRRGEIVREVSVRAPRPFRIKYWKDVPECLRIEAVEGGPEPAQDGGVIQKLRLRLQPDAPLGIVQTKVTAETDLGAAPLELTVAWRVVGPVAYFPEKMVQFQLRKNDQDHQVQVKIRPTAPEEPVPQPRAELLGGVAGVMSVAVETLPAEAQFAAGWVVRVTLPKGTPPGPYNGTLRISYPDSPGIAAIEMPVMARVQEPR